ncbi:hypothetical protein OS493_004077 [Desmophyllum pertusum]|uniref:Peripheral subunit-binding (PSBD) domain-containing protein n=1 Tax=Desmophyllum pertusum TaxID=174260 RepID=A0A9W9ZSK0_9CNID|nr:hypothetical protein OS493_004077 [Desmophyllum pertusum]
MVEEGVDYTQVEVPVDTEIHRDTEDSASGTSSSTHGDADVLMSPAVRVLLETYQLNPRLIQATGPKGRLLKGDVLRYVAQGGKPFTKPEEETTAEVKVPIKAAPSQPTKPAPERTVGVPYYKQVN